MTRDGREQFIPQDRDEIARAERDALVREQDLEPLACDRRVAFCTPALCSANVSWVHVARELKRPYLINPLVDRLMEFGRPAGWPYLFEGIRTRKEFRVYGNKLRRLARTHFGWAGPEFSRRLERWLKADLPRGSGVRRCAA